MPSILAENHYGESRIRLFKVERQPGRHAFKELLVGVRFEGDFERSYTLGDNTNILPTDTMKNTVYALAKLYRIEQVEEFAVRIADHFLDGNPQLSRVRVDVAEQPWNRVIFGGKPHWSTFTLGGPEKRTALVATTRDASTVQAGVADLVLVKTAGPGFAGYRRDPFTTIETSAEGLLAVSVTATWTYANNEIPFGPYWHGVREAMLETFVEHESRSMHHTLYTMAEAVLDRYEDIVEIHLALPNRHSQLVDLRPLGLGNESEIFAPLEEPREVIEARVRRRDPA